MGKRRLEESDYDPIASDLARDVKLAVAPPTSVSRAEPSPVVTEPDRIRHADLVLAQWMHRQLSRAGRAA